MEELSDQKLFLIVSNINDIFYDKVFEDEWLKLIFDGVPPEHIKNQQTDFIVKAFGGPKRYSGRSPRDAHPHIFIQEDMWELRERYLLEAFAEANAPEWMREKWIAIDNAFKNSILNKSPDECEGRYRSEPIINIPNPKNGFKKAA